MLPVRRSHLRRQPTRQDSRSNETSWDDDLAGCEKDKVVKGHRQSSTGEGNAVAGCAKALRNANEPFERPKCEL